MSQIDQNAKIYIAGHRGLVGSAIVRHLQKLGFKNLLLKTSAEVNLVKQAEVDQLFNAEKPEYVIVAAAKVGGIIANRDAPTEFLYDNLMIASNVIHASAEINVKKLLFLGSSCIFPKLAEQPIKESSMLTGSLESTNEGYAIAKIAGLKLTEYYNRQHKKRFISAMPPNMYGPGDNFHPDHSHVIPGLMRRFHEAKEQGLGTVKVWGTGTPLREFLFVDDLAKACWYLMEHYEESSFINVGSGEEVTIRKLAELVAKTVGFQGKIEFDSSKPDGTPRKVMDHSRIKALGWKSVTPLEQGLHDTYQWFLQNQTKIRQA